MALQNHDNERLCEIASLKAGYVTSCGGMMTGQVPYFFTGHTLQYVRNLNCPNSIITPKLKNILEINPDSLPVDYPTGFPSRKPVWKFYSLYGRMYEGKAKINLVGGMGYWEFVSTTPATPLAPGDVDFSPNRLCVTNRPWGYVNFTYTTYKFYRGNGEETSWLMAMRKKPSPQRIDAWVECMIYDRSYASFVRN
ncbi:hypothetical protein OROMI_020645 [Orobanche minor]